MPMPNSIFRRQLLNPFYTISKPKQMVIFVEKKFKILAFAGSLRKGSYNKVLVRAAVELAPENVEIEVGTNELSLTAKSDLQKEAEGKTYLHRERAFSTFHRHIGFGESIDTQQVSAKIVEGILEMRLPKLGSRPEKKTRKVTIQ